MSELVGAGRIPADKLAYLQTRLAARIHQAILGLFDRLERESGLTRKTLARRMGRSPEQITRWFSYPSNLTLATTSDIFAAMGYEIENIDLVSLDSGSRLVRAGSQSELLQLADSYQRQETPSAVEPRPSNRPCSAQSQAMLQAWNGNRGLEDRWNESTLRRDVHAIASGDGLATSAQLQIIKSSQFIQ